MASAPGRSPTLPRGARRPCEFDAVYTFEASLFATGPHEVEVFVADYAGNITTRNFNVSVINPIVHDPPARRGLEHYFHYDTTETGAGSSANVNLATGNVVWHKQPLEIPGRGLSTVLNLTYNSATAIDQPRPTSRRRPTLASGSTPSTTTTRSGTGSRSRSRG